MRQIVMSRRTQALLSELQHLSSRDRVRVVKARGVHEVDLDADLIRALIQQGMEEEEIATHLGIDLDTVHRYKQVTGIAALFSGARYSMAWEIQEVD